MVLDAQPVEALPEAAPVARHDVGQGGNHRSAPTTCRHWRPVLRCPRQPHHTTDPRHRQLVLLHQDLSDPSLRERRDSFRFRTSLRLDGRILEGEVRYAASGQPIGVEITAPLAVPLTRLATLLAEVDESSPAEHGYEPVRAV